MDTPYSIELLRGVYAAELLRRGFRPLGQVKDLLKVDMLRENKMTFVWSRDENRCTYALDEAGVFWKCEGYLDLADLGFTQQPLEDDGEEPSVH